MGICSPSVVLADARCLHIYSSLVVLADVRFLHICSSLVVLTGEAAHAGCAAHPGVAVDPAVLDNAEDRHEEADTSKKRMVCSNCLAPGHNKRSCKAQR